MMTQSVAKFHEVRPSHNGSVAFGRADRLQSMQTNNKHALLE
jgi:hypothetical protein